MNKRKKEGIPDDNLKRREKIRRHLEKWKSTYEVGFVLLAFMVSCVAMIISLRAVGVSNEALELQRSEYRLRNRNSAR